jgi:hypothetical protein
MKKLLLVTAALSALLLTGCASRNGLMSPAESADRTIPNGKAVITFYRPAYEESRYQAPLAKAVPGNVVFVGAANSGTKFREVVAPGEYTYVVAGDNAHLLKACVAADKAYYVRIDSKPGNWKADFTQTVVTPKQLSGAFAADQIKKQKLVKTNEMGEKWFTAHRTGMLEKLAAGMRDYDAETEEQQRTHTLRPEDGIDTLY